MGSVQYHDYRLRGYRIEDLGAVVTLDLVYDYPGAVVRESQIRFQHVKLYQFLHTAPAIITSIEEVPLTTVLAEHGSSIRRWATRQGVAGWRSDTQQLLMDWAAATLKAWCIDSAIGFTGFVVAASLVGVPA